MPNHSKPEDDAVCLDIGDLFQKVFSVIRFLFKIIKFLFVLLVRIGSFTNGVRVVAKSVSYAATFAAYAGGTHYVLKALGYEPGEAIGSALVWIRNNE